MKTLAEFNEEATRILESTYTPFILAHDLRGRVRADHLCYKCGSSEEFERMKALFERDENGWI